MATLGIAKQFYFCNNKENGYYYKNIQLKKLLLLFLKKKNTLLYILYIEGIPEEERVLFSSRLFSIEETPVFSLSYYLKKLFLNNKGGSQTPFDYLNNLYIDSRQKYKKYNKLNR
ncbi:hypothetical protein AZF37_09405 [endosymbiont 'TC1' of Trimyema compressum]|uniref:hypothetical protein n=1 Tax=endosymbiont 'TC1' of Trimyema compressum TaxID=243899 RepID=UPI0007F16B5D|nr:hypothetical protein [endosymbiont 'TC1' of Trimyema compressum]AMP21333.1 hypothetical protein AZF37_09405 [endosymbiont 'TC1' of Trimyema compressum]